MTGYGFAVGACIVLVTIVLALLRTKRMREKYAGVWLALAAATVVLVLFPDLATGLARLLGVATTVNLLFALAFVVLLVVCIHLSTELSRVEDQSRTIAEEVALLRLDLEEQGRSAERPADGPRQD